MMFYIAGSFLVASLVFLYFFGSSDEEPIQIIQKPALISFGLFKTIYIKDNVKYELTHKTESINGLESYINSFKHQNFRRKILFAELSGKYGKEDVTEILKMAQGLKADFHLEIPNAATTWDSILYDFDLSDWNRLIIIDSFGKVHNIEISTTEGRIIRWNNQFKLE